MDRFVTTSLLVLTLWSTPLLAQEPAAPLELDVVGERPHPHEPSNEDALAASVVRRERLEAPGLTAAEVLRAESGVAVVQYGGFGSAATASVRGATAAQTPVYLGGIRINDEVAGAADLSVVPLWLIDRIEIYRGNAPLAADEFGIGGAISFMPVRPRGNAAGASLSAGSFGTAGGYAFAAAGGERQALLVGASFTSAENDYPFEDNRGTAFVPGDDVESRQQNIDVSLLDAWTVGAFDLPGGVRIDVLGNVVAREQGVPHLALLPTEETRARYERVLVGARARSPFGAERQHELELMTSFTNATSVYDDPELEVLLVPRMEVTGRRASQRALADFELTPSLRLTTVLDASVDQLLREDGDVQELRADARSGRAAAGLSFQPWTGLFLLPVVALACRSALGGADLCQQSEPVGRLALAWRTRSLTAFAGAGRYVRFPTLSEVHGGGILVRGNENLRPEEGITADLGARFQRGFGALELWADAAAYARRANDLISYARSMGQLVPVNVQSARILGLETSAGADYATHVGLDVGLTFTDPRDVTEGRQAENDVLPFQSRFRAAAGLSGRVRRTRARLSVLHQSSRYADPAGLIVIPAQTSFDLELEQGLLRDQIKARARLHNLFDAPAFDVVGYPLPGRSVYVSMETTL
ncbi:MAG TPA: TonB-dependent receptor [Polyangiaceae bacterium]|nr:TonB-dependent receptor [Polyangiaceae bacterium]